MAERKVEIEIKQVANGSGSAAVKRIWKETEANAKQTQKVIEQAAKDRAQAELAIEKSLLRSKQNFLKSLEMSTRDTARKMKSVFGEVIAGTFLGTSASSALSSGLSRAFSGLQTAFQKSLDFSQMKVSLAQFEGSMEAAERRIQTLFKVAQDTPGLSFLSAVEGQKRLMAVGFAGDQATKILQGLSKVRVLSGSTKEDFDAMIVNLVQIASGGQRVTQEIREMATRMPALVGIIRKEFGGIGQELNEIDPKEFVNRLANAAASSKADFNSMSLAVENLQDAWDRLYIAVGSVIEQNPEVLAAIRVLTKELDGNSDALKTNKGEIRSTFSEWVSWAAKGSIAVTNFVDEAQADVSALQNALAAGLNVITGSLMEVIRAVGNYVNLVVIKPINGIISVAQALGPLFGGIASQVSQIPEITLPENIFFRAAQLNGRDVSNSAAKQRSNTRWVRFQEELDAINAMNAKKNAPSGRGWRGMFYGKDNDNTTPPENNRETGTGSKGGGVRGRSGSAKSNLPEFGSMKELVISTGNAQWDSWFVEMGHKFNVDPNVLLLQAKGESGFRKGAVSPKGAQGFSQIMPATAKRFGVNVNSVKDSIRGQAEYMSLLLSMFGGDYNLALAGYNAGEGRVQQAGNRIPKIKETQNYVSSIRSKYGRQVRRGASYGGTSGDVQQDIGEFLRKQSDQLTKEDRERVLRAMVALYEGAGLIPTDELLRDFTELAIEDARQKGTVQPSKADVLNRFRTGSLNRLTPITDAPQGVVQTSITTREEAESNRVLNEILGNLKDTQFGLNEQTEEAILLRKIELGMYPELIGNAKELALIEARKTDALIKKKKADEDALEAMRRYQEEQQRLFDETTNFFEGKINSFIDGGFKGLWQSILDDMRRNFVRQFSTLLAQAFTPNFSGVQQSGGGMSGGGSGNVFGNIFSGIFGGGGGGAMGPGGTPMFNPANNFVTGGSGQGGFGSFLGTIFSGFGGSNMTGAGTGAPGSGNAVGTGAFGGLGSGGSSGGGLFGNFKKLFSTGEGGIFAPRGGSKAAGIMGGIGDIAAIVGSFIPGRAGSVISMAGTGASLGSMFGPWGAAIGAGVGALIGIFSGRDNAAQKIKEAALSTYGVTLKDKSVINSIKAIGETYFGKGKVGENASQLMQVDEVKNIIRNYAEATGQNSAKVDMLSHGDAEWSGNRFMGKFGGYRAMGGPVRAGMTYIVGERGPESFTPKTDGAIVPGLGGVEMNRLLVVVGQLEKTIDYLASRLQSISAGEMLAMGAEENPEAIQRGVEMSFERDGRATTNFARLTGQYV